MSRTAPLKAFEILGVTPGDDFATIRRAWIRLVKQHHPDLVAGDADDLTRKLTELNEAYDSLSWHNPEKVKIRTDREAERKRSAQQERRENEPRRAKPDRRTAETPPHDTSERRSSTERRTEEEHRVDPDRRDGTASGSFADRGMDAWASLTAADRFRAVKALCDSDALARAARNRRCV
jgi:curved DNA-binding protein CbpA